MFLDVHETVLDTELRYEFTWWLLIILVSWAKALDKQHIAFDQVIKHSDESFVLPVLLHTLLPGKKRGLWQLKQNILMQTTWRKGYKMPLQRHWFWRRWRVHLSLAIRDTTWRCARNSICAVTDNSWPDSWSRGVLSRATEKDRLIPKHKPLAWGFWQINYTIVSMPPAVGGWGEKKKKKTGISLWMNSNSAFKAVGNSNEWVQACGDVPGHRVTHNQVFERRTEAEWGSQDIIGSIVWAIVPASVWWLHGDRERYGNIWDIISEWQLIPPWERTRH